MSVLAVTTVLALLIASPSSTDASQVAANGGFLLGNAHRCGIPNERVVRAGELIRDLILATAEDADEQDEANEQFARFFIDGAFVAPEAKKPVASCRTVTSEFERLERHQPAAQDAHTAGAGRTGSGFRLGDGE